MLFRSFDISVQVGRCRMGGQRMIIRNEKEAVVFVLHLQEIFHGPEIVSEVQVACAADTAYDDLFHGSKGNECLFKGTSDTLGYRTFDQPVR